MPQIDSNLPLIQQMLVDLSLIGRSHYLAKTNRRENDIEHSMSVAVLCWYLHEKLDSPPLDTAKILKYAMAHDFVERYAGDVNTFASKAGRDKKIADESASLTRLSKELREFPALVEIMNGYESKSDEESRFVWTVDKMQPLIMGDLDSWRPYEELGITYAQFVDKYEELLSQSSPYCREFFMELIEYSKSTYYDQPA